MSNPRFQAIESAGKRTVVGSASHTSSSFKEHFESLVFSRSVMRKMLPKEVYQNVLDAMEAKAKINPAFADTIALAMKDWAVSHGATHYTHWFQPLTGASAEKHDAFLDWSQGHFFEQFSGKQLIQGEPDASSFPSGGLRSTYEARGYTGWDPTSPAFIWKGGDGATLCIPTIFFSWTGEVLDTKIPLLRSDTKINDAALRLLKLTGIKAAKVYSTLGLEQEYFVIDRSLRNLRSDLLLLGKTVYGASSPKGQELQDHYLGSVKDRVLAFMLDFEIEALKLGIPVKTRHNEVAPGQHEVAPVFEIASRAIDHNILLMELMRHVAVKHHLACLLHEKPFNGLNGSGKHSNWSLATDTGINLLDPSDTPGNNLHFLVLFTAILHAVHRHSALLRASIGSASNDDRLGGHEAPPAIISAYLGQEIELILDAIVEKGGHSDKRKNTIYDLGLPIIPDLSKDHTDRNRTSPLAFTGNKFEFRAVGSSANPAFSITVLNAIVAESLNQILDEIENNLGKKRTLAALVEAVIPVIRQYLRASKPIRYSGDNYSEAWRKEAAFRKLPFYKKSVHALESYLWPSTLDAFKDILTKQEILSRYEIAHENYMHMLNIEINLMLDIFQSQILPAAMQHQKNCADAIDESASLLGSKKALKAQIKLFKDFNDLLEQAITQAEVLKNAQKKALKGDLGERGIAFVELINPKKEALRQSVDQLEKLVDDRLWPIPKYRELLFVIE